MPMLVVAALRGECQTLHEICFAEVKGLGPEFADFLRHCLQSGEFSPQQQLRMETAARLADSGDEFACYHHRQAAAQRAVMEGLCSANNEIRDKAIAALPDLCEEPARAVIEEVAKNVKRPLRCLALLIALQESGLRLTESDYAALVDLLKLFPKVDTCGDKGPCQGLFEPDNKE